MFIGSCTNSRIGDLRAAAEMVEGRRVAEGLYAMVVPGSVQVKSQAEAEGLDDVFRAAGFDWRGAGCSMCLGMNPDILQPGERCASTSNRNFEGRQGRGGRTHLVSPQMAAAAAVEGHFVDIRELELTMDAINASSTAASRSSTATTSTPTRSSPSSSSSASSARGFGEFLFYDWAKQPGWELPVNPILATGRNFGCGSSREHAPWALEDYGFKAIIAPSFADIFYSNCTKIGLLPVVLGAEDVQGGDGRGRGGDRPRGPGGRVRRARRRRFDIDPEIKYRLLNGLDDIGQSLEREADIDRFERERARHGAL